jgi:hypothetical protein
MARHVMAEAERMSLRGAARDLHTGAQGMGGDPLDSCGGRRLDCAMAAEAQPPQVWAVAGSYFEACNCEAVCPCRQVGGRPGGERSTYGICQFGLSWQIGRGRADGLVLDDLAVVMAGWYDDDEPGKPWRVTLYLDERADPEQHTALAAIFLGRAGGSTLRNFAAAIGTVQAVRRARVELSHVPRRWSIRADKYVTVYAETPVEAPGPVACGIPGLDRPGQEVIADSFRADDAPLSWDLHGRCGFATDFAYSSHD